MTDLPARLRQDAIYFEKLIVQLAVGHIPSLWLRNVPATEALMRDAAAEIERLRKIEAAARLIDECLRDNPAAEVAWRHAIRNRLTTTPWENVDTSGNVVRYRYGTSQIQAASVFGEFMALLTDLRKSLETDTDG